MRIFLYIGIFVLLSGCSQEEVKLKPTDRFYLYSSRNCDTIYIDSLNFDTAGLTKVADVHLTGYCMRNNFGGHVIKYTNSPAPVDGEMEYYFTPDLGIIYSRATTWANFTRLHSTNDSIEKRINDYVDHILNRPDLVRAGDIELVPIQHSR